MDQSEDGRTANTWDTDKFIFSYAQHCGTSIERKQNKETMDHIKIKRHFWLCWRFYHFYQ
jgi:hypothetical protein